MIAICFPQQLVLRNDPAETSTPRGSPGGCTRFGSLYVDHSFHEASRAARRAGFLPDFAQLRDSPGLGVGGSGDRDR